MPAGGEECLQVIDQGCRGVHLTYFRLPGQQLRWLNQGRQRFAPLAAAVAEFDPDQIVIATEPPEQSIWHRFDVVDRARSDYHIPVTNVIAMAPSEEPVA